MDDVESAAQINVLDKYRVDRQAARAREEYEHTLGDIEQLVGGSVDGSTTHGRLAQIALQNAYDKLKLTEANASSAIDQTSGLLSRRVLATELFENIDDVRAGRASDVRLYAVDLNNLKFVNDTLGHEAGNRYIRAAGDALSLFAARGLKPGRTGGDEMVVIGLPGRDDSEQLRLALSASIGSYAAEIDSPYPLGAAVGHGVLTPVRIEHEIDGPKRSIEHLIEMSGAEAAMYSDKERMKGGRSYR